MRLKFVVGWVNDQLAGGSNNTTENLVPCGHGQGVTGVIPSSHSTACDPRFSQYLSSTSDKPGAPFKYAHSVIYVVLRSDQSVIP